MKFLKCVNFNVSLQVPLCYKRLRTLGATVAFLASVKSYEMLRQVRRLSKGLCTMGAAKTFLKNVNSYLSLQDTFRYKRLCTLGAFVEFLASENCLMVSKKIISRFL